MRRLLARWFGADPPSIRDAQREDAGALAALHTTGFHRPWSDGDFARFVADPNVIAQVARARGGRGPVVGAVLSRRTADEAEILTVVVAPQARGHGLSRDLLRHHLGRLAAAGVRRVFLEVAEDNGPARRLYAGFGFAQVGTRPGYYARSGGSEMALVLRRDIA